MTTLTTGVDAEWSRWLVGNALGLSEGTGGYRASAAAVAWDSGAARLTLGRARFRTTLASVHPYARLQAGYGAGDLDVATAAGERRRANRHAQCA